MNDLSKQNNCNIIIEFKYPSQSIAKLVNNATRQDNDGIVLTKISGNKLIASVSAKNIASLIHTIDDYLECVVVAERIISEKSIKKHNGRKNTGKKK